ncbi:MAG: beta strand repeat-containing protein, partial [Candidatus Paceibacterota bacterium]
GDTSPAALLTVGNGDLFQVNSSGAIAAATGVTTSGTVSIGASTPVTITNSALTTGANYTIGNSSNQLTLSTSYGSFNSIQLLNSGGLGGVFVENSNSAPESPYLWVGNSTKTVNSATDVMGIRVNTNLTATSSSATYTGILLSNTINQTGSASGATYGLRINPTLTALSAAGYSAVYIDANNASAYGINQVGSSSKNYFAGNTGFGDTSPAALLTVGNGDLFQVNSSGAIAAATGITSSGTITLSGLGGGGTQCVQVSNTGVLSGAGAACGSGSSTWNSITNPTGTQSLTFDDAELNAWTISSDTETFHTYTANSLTTGKVIAIASSSLTSGSLIDLAVTGTGGLTGQKALNISNSGANATSTQTTYGAFLSNTRTGTASTNVGLYATASGGTNNYAAIFDAGNVGIGDTTPVSALTVGSGDAFQVNSSGAIAAVTGYTQGSGTMSITSANTTQTTTSSALALNVNSLTSGTGMYIASSTLTSGSLIDLAVTGTGALTNQKGLNISISGANGTVSQTTYGAYLSNTHTGSGTNVGLYATASGGSSNYAAIFDSGNVGIGDTTPTALFTVGASDAFQVNSSGAIAAATGITSSGTITLSGLGGGGTQCVQVSNTGVLS